MSETDVTITTQNTDMVRDRTVVAFTGDRKKVRRITFGADVRGIAAHVFERCPALQAIDLGGVVNLGESAFDTCEALTEIRFGNTLEEVGAFVFRHCYSLKRVCLPRMTTVPVGMFNVCQSLKEVVLADNTRRIERKAFESCTALESVQGLRQVTFIGERAFFRCHEFKTFELSPQIESIRSDSIYMWGERGGTPILSLDGKRLLAYPGAKGCVDVPNGVTCICGGAFSHFPISPSYVKLPNGLETIECGAFKYCGFMKRIDIPASVSKIEEGAFEECELLSVVTGVSSHQGVNGRTFMSCAKMSGRILMSGTELLGIPDPGENLCLPTGISAIANGAFRSQVGLRSVRVPEGCVRIGAESFAKCRDLEEVFLPESLECIDRRAFAGCGKLKSITIPAGMKGTMDVSALNDCPELCDVIVKGDHFRLVDGDHAFQTFCQGCPKMRGKLIVSPKHVLVSWIPDGETLTVPKDIRVIGSGAFVGAGKLYFVSLPEGLVKIEDEAFVQCHRLGDVTIPTTVVRIGREAFNVLTRVTLQHGWNLKNDAERSKVVHNEFGNKGE